MRSWRDAVRLTCRSLIAAIEGLLEEDFDLAGVQTSTGPHSPLLIINGPIRQELRVNCSSGALGPGWQANATIGRAIRLILNNIGGARIGITDMTTLGMAENFTYCFGENEEASPWPPFHVEQGFEKEENTVSVIGAYSPEQVSDHVGIEPEEILTVAADVISKITRFHLLTVGALISCDSVLVLCPEHAGSIAKRGWTKRDVQQFLFEKSRIPHETLALLRRRIESYPDILFSRRKADGPNVPNPGEDQDHRGRRPRETFRLHEYGPHQENHHKKDPPSPGMERTDGSIQGVSGWRCGKGYEKR